MAINAVLVWLFWGSPLLAPAVTGGSVTNMLSYFNPFSLFTTSTGILIWIQVCRYMVSNQIALLARKQLIRIPEAL